MGILDEEHVQSPSPQFKRHGQRKRTQSEDGQVKRNHRISSRYKFGYMRGSLTEEAKKIQDLEQEIKGLQHMLTSLNDSIDSLKVHVEEIRPTYREALRLLSSPRQPHNSKSSFQLPTGYNKKNNLIFHGVQVDELEDMMSSEPDFCRDVLETRIKTILKEQLKISRDISFNDAYRLNPIPSGQNKCRFGPIVVNFRSPRDKENVMRQSKILKGLNIWITDDCSDKSEIKHLKYSLFPKNSKAMSKRHSSSSNSEKSH